MIHPFRYRGWLAISECDSGGNEYTKQTGLLPWGMRYTIPVNCATVYKKKDQHFQNSEVIQNEEVYESMQAIHDATTEPNNLIGTKHIANVLNISMRQVQRLAKRGKLPPPVPHSKNLLWVREEFFEWSIDGGGTL